MPRTSSFDGLRKLLDKQLSVASRGQLLALGMADRAMQYRLRPGGPWQAVLPGVYLAVTGTPTFEQKEMAALLYAGPGSVVTGPAALTHHGLRVPGALTHHDQRVPGAVPVVDVLVPVTRQRIDLNFVRLHRTARMPARPVPAGPVRLAPVPRAVADTAWQLTSLDDVRAIVTDALRSGQCTVSQLTAELNEGPIRGSAAFRSALADLGAPAATP
jgi:hypothetical protein